MKKFISSMVMALFVVSAAHMSFAEENATVKPVVNAAPASTEVKAKKIKKHGKRMHHKKEMKEVKEVKEVKEKGKD